MNEFVPGTVASQFQGYTAVMPGISIGNVGQMTLDVLLNTYLHLGKQGDTSVVIRRIGAVDSDFLSAFFGDNPFRADNDNSNREQNSALQAPCTGADVYEMTNPSPVLFIQQRAHIIEGYENSYYEQLFQWLQAMGVSDVLVISGANASQRDDRQLQGPPFRYISFPAQNNTKTKLSEKLEYGGINVLEPASVTEATVNTLLDNFHGGEEIPEPTSKVSDKAVITAFKTFADTGGMGYVPRICRQALDSSTISCTVFLQFVNEGDNTTDAFIFAAKLATLLDISKGSLDKREDSEKILQTLRAPPSWKRILGEGLDPSLYT